jgi:NAD(P)-dependent dehydrogenase (short-subunit alcohol dehydrogenase family)
VSNIVSDFLDTTVVGGFSRIGYEWRSRSRGFEPPEALDLRGRRIVVTGPTSGLGLATARMLAPTGADLVLVGRDAARTTAAAGDIAGSATGRVDTVTADMSDLNAVASACAGMGPVDVIVHNAGALLDSRQLSRQGIEMTVAAHVVGPHLMTRLLLPTLARSGGRVVTVASGGMYAADLPRVAGDRTLEMNEVHWNGTRQYAIAKRAQVTLNEMWAAEQPGVHFAAMHPGWADTPGVKLSLPLFRVVTRPILRTARQGADTIAWLAGVEGIPAPSGSFWCDRETRPIHKSPSTRASDTPDRRDGLWQWVQSVTDPFVN